jgi:cell wall-associated NlpC family hydrolase
MSSERTQYLCGLIGRPYQYNAKGPEAFDCWHLVRDVRGNLYRDVLPEYDIPDEPSLLWMAKAFRDEPERLKWQEISDPKDGSLVLMSRATSAVHVGIFIREGGVLHTTKEHGVLLQDITTLRASGWGNLRFFERVGHN